MNNETQICYYTHTNTHHVLLLCLELRGIQAEVTWLEEFAHIKPDIIKDIVVPLAQLATNRIWAISSPLDENNHASQLALAVDPKTQRRIFTVIRAAWCLECCKSSTATSCHHTKKRLPTQFSARSAREARVMLGDDTARANQELLGEAKGNHVYFMQPYIGPLIQKPAQILGQCDVVWTFVDPSPGNSPSDFAVLSVVRLANPFQIVIVGMSTYEGDGSGQNFLDGSDLIVNHLEKIMDHPCLYKSKIVLIEEAVHHVDCVGWYTDQVLSFFKARNQEDRIFIEKGMPNPLAYGVGKTERMTWAMAKKTREYLKSDFINFAELMISEDPEGCRKKLITQLSSFFVLETIKPDGTRKVLIRSRGKDDLAVCLQSVIYHESRIREESAEFKDWVVATTWYSQSAYAKSWERRSVA